MIESRRMHNKSRIAVMKGSSLENKENVSNNTTRSIKKGHLNGTQKSNRKTLAAKDNVNSRAKQETKSSKVKSTPNFEQLHKKWESKLAKKKAITKRPNTKIEAFNLTKEVAKDQIDEIDEFTDNEHEVVDSDSEDDELEKGCSTGGISDAVTVSSKGNCISCGVESQTFVTPSKKEQFKVPTTRNKNLSSAKIKNMVQSNHDKDPFDFQPDSDALKSILNNVGVDHLRMRGTPNTITFCSPSPRQQKRTSIYYTGRRADLPPSKFEQRLSMRQVIPMDGLRGDNLTTPRYNFRPMNTLVGIQETSGTFSISPEEEHPIDMESSPNNDLPQDHTVLCSHPASSNESEASWADTLKYYSNGSNSNEQLHEACNESQDTDPLLAQLEEEVIRNLNRVDIVSEDISLSQKQVFKNSTTSHTNIVSGLATNVQEYPSVFRQLFPSPSVTDLDNGDTGLRREDWSTNQMPFNENVLSNSCTKTSMEQNYLTTIGTKSIKNVDLSVIVEDEPVRDTSNSALINTVPCSLFTKFNKDNPLSQIRSTGFVSIQSMTNKIFNVPSSVFKSNDAPPRFSCQTKNGVSAFVRIPTSQITTQSHRINLINTDCINTKLVIPTPQRAIPCEKLSRHRQIIQDSLIKSRDHAHEILLDAEVSLYARNIELSRKKFGFNQRLENPVAKLFMGGDDMHFVPINT